MENASKALLFAAEALIGVVILSIGVALFMMFQGYTQNTAEELMESQITEFNNNFTKYYGEVRTYDEEDKIEKIEPIKVSAHDIVSVINFAFQNNLSYELISIDENTKKITVDPEVVSNIKNTYYVKIGVKIKTGENKGDNYNIENWSDEQKNLFLLNHSLKDNSKKEFKCTKCEINPETRRVFNVYFEEI